MHSFGSHPVGKSPVNRRSRTNVERRSGFPGGGQKHQSNRYEQAKADAERAIRLSPHDIDVGIWHVDMGDAVINLGNFDGAIAEYRKAPDLGWQQAFFVHTNLAAAYAQAGKWTRRRPS